MLIECGEPAAWDRRVRRRPRKVLSSSLDQGERDVEAALRDQKLIGPNHVFYRSV